MKQLGIIIPAYNVEHCLEDLLNALVKQMTDAVEVVIIDDGSRDNTLATATRFSSENITVIHQENQGVGAARNKGIEVCTAEYLWFIDADDNIRPSAVHTLLDAINRKPSDCYLFGVEKIRGSITTKIANPTTLQLTRNSDIARNFDTIFSENLLNPLWNKAFRNSIIRQRHIRFSSIPSGEDAEFVLHYLAHANSMYIMPTILYRYTLMSDTSSAHTYHPAYIADHQQMFKALTEYCTVAGAHADNVKKQWQRETYLGACDNIRNGLGKHISYLTFRKSIAKQQTDLHDLLSLIGPINYRGFVSILYHSTLLSYLYLAFRDWYFNHLRHN